MGARRFSRPLLLLAGTVAAVAIVVAAGAQSAAPNLIPYTGHLDSDGMPVTGEVDMTFFLVGSPTGTFANALWSERHPGVRVSGGAFGATLGAGTPATPIPAALLRDQPALYIGVKLGPGDGVELAGKQRLLSGPYALASASARDFTVTGALSVQGSATIGGNLRVGGSLLGTPVVVQTFSQTVGGTASTATTTALTDGFVTAQLSATTDGAGGFVRGFIDNAQVAVEHFHYYTGSVNTDYVNSGSISFLVRRGATWRVEAGCIWPACAGDVRWTPIGTPP